MAAVENKKQIREEATKEVAVAAFENKKTFLKMRLLRKLGALRSSWNLYLLLPLLGISSSYGLRSDHSC